MAPQPGSPRSTAALAPPHSAPHSFPWSWVQAVDSLPAAERVLLGEHLARLEGVLGPGLTRLNWNSLTISDFAAGADKVRCALSLGWAAAGWRSAAGAAVALCCVPPRQASVGRALPSSLERPQIAEIAASAGAPPRRWTFPSCSTP